MGILIKIIMTTTILCTLLLLCSSCQKIRFSDDELQLERKNYSGNQLRIDGYYHEQKSNATKGNSFFFFRNGVLLYGYSFSKSEQEEFETNWKDGSYEKLVKENKSSWGIFTIEADKIKIEKWYPGNTKHLPAFVKEGVVLNDTMFKITSFYRLTKKGKKRDCEDKDETYYFVPFSPKPDSTNFFVD
jgi:hypothetical protein